MTESTPTSSGILADAKRMAPVWGIIFVAAVGSLYAIRSNGRQYLERGIFEQENSCDIAQVRRHAGEKIWFDLARELGSDNARAGSSEGAFRNDARVRAAIDHFTDAASLCPRMGGVHGYLADLSWWMGDLPRVHYHQGREHLVLNELDDALVEFRTASLLDESDLRPGEQILGVSLRRGELALAVEFLETGPDGLEGTVAGLQTRAAEMERRREYSSAAELLDRALQQEPGNRQVILAFLDVHRSMGESTQGALKAFDYLRRATAPEADSYHSVALILMQESQWTEALRAIERALAIQPNSSVLMMERSAVLFELGRDIEARAMLQDAFARDPQGFTARLAQERFARLRAERQ